MKTRIVHTKIWQDSFFSGLTTEQKLLFIYYITNENVSIIHLYECSDRKVIFDTGVTQDQLTNAKNKFQAEKKLYFFNDFVYIANASRYEEYKGELNEKAKARAYAQLTKEVLEWYYTIADTPIHTPIYTHAITPKERKTSGIAQFQHIGEVLHKQKSANA